MGHRLFEVMVPPGYEPRLKEVLTEASVVGYWQESHPDWDHINARILVDEGSVEALIGKLEDKFVGVETFRVVLLPVEATVPRPPLAEEADPSGEATTAEQEAAREERTLRISAQELYADVTDSFDLNPVWMLLVALSAIVAALGLIQDSVVVVIGAMVIAPLLGSNMGLALATTLADTGLAKRAVKVSVVGVGLVVLLSVALGAGLSVNPSSHELASRTDVGLSDIALALASGAAGALSFTMGLSAALIGVMVAVALLPPVVAAGLLVGAGSWELAAGAALLGVTNLICINLAAVVTFAWQGIRPRNYWEAGRARRATATAVALWVLLLAGLAAIIWYAQLG